MSTRISTVSFESAVIECFDSRAERIVKFINDSYSTIIKLPCGGFHLAYGDQNGSFFVSTEGRTLEEAFDKIEAAVEILSR